MMDLVADQDLEVDHVAIKIAFLCADLEEEIFMKPQPFPE